MNTLSKILVLFILLIPSLAFSQNSIGDKYYALINKGYEAFYLAGNIVKADSFFEEANKIRKPISYDAINIAKVYIAANDINGYIKSQKWVYETAGSTLIEDTSSKMYIALKKSDVYSNRRNMIQNHQGFYSTLFMAKVNELLGIDQFVRQLPKTEYNSELFLFADSFNYAKLVEEIDNWGFPSILNIDNVTLDRLSLLYMHCSPRNDSIYGNKYFEKLYTQEYNKGNLSNTLIPKRIERNAINEGDQLFGFYTKRLNGKKFYEPIKDIKSVDSLRMQFGLPILAIDAIQNNIELPNNYSVNDKYTYLKGR